MRSVRLQKFLSCRAVPLLPFLLLLVSHPGCKQPPPRAPSNLQAELTPEKGGQPAPPVPSVRIDSTTIVNSLPWLLDTLDIGWENATIRDYKVSRDQKFVSVNLSDHPMGPAYRFLIYSPTDKKIFYPEIDDLREQGLGYPGVRYGFDTLCSRAVVIVGYRSLMARIVSLPNGRVTWEEELPELIDDPQFDSIISGLLDKH